VWFGVFNIGSAFATSQKAFFLLGDSSSNLILNP
jgi:hypothetical protein